MRKEIGIWRDSNIDYNKFYFILFYFYHQPNGGCEKKEKNGCGNRMSDVKVIFITIIRKNKIGADQSEVSREKRG